MGNKSILNAALEYLDQGFSVIPIRPGPDKKPYIPWTEFQKRHASEEEVYRWWEQWPNANVAIITGSISGIFVIDGDGEIGNRWICDNLPKTSVYAKTGRAEGGCHCFYRIPPGDRIANKVNWRPKVDVRGEGGYVVAAPSIHHSGTMYSLIFREGLEGWKDLHSFNPYQMHGGGPGNLNIDLSRVPLPGEEFRGAEHGSRNDSMARVLGKLLKAGMRPEDAYDQLEIWNQKNRPPIGKREFNATFRSILKRHEASAPVVLPEPEPIIVEESATDRAIAPDKTDCYPVECLQPGGLLQEIMNYTEKSSAASKPIFALAGAIALVGHLCGQRLQTETGLRTNIYGVSVGYSGAGKNAPHSAISHILLASDARVSIGPTDTASGVALLKWLTTDGHCVSLFTFDEIGMLLRGVKNPASPMAELPRILTKIFSETDRPISKSYADAKLNIAVPYHHLTLYASSTPGEFWGNLTEADTVSGFLARLLLFVAMDEAEKPRSAISPEVPKGIITAVNALWAMSPPIDQGRGDIARVPVPFVVPRSSPAQAIFSEWSDGYWDLRNKHRDDEAKSAIYGRAAEHAAKLSLIHAASLKGGKPKEVGPDSISWATKTVDACINALLRGVTRNISKNAFHADQQKVLKKLRSKNGEMTLREIHKMLHMPAQKTNDIISSLLLSGEIRQEERKSETGRPSVWVVLSQIM